MTQHRPPLHQSGAAGTPNPTDHLEQPVNHTDPTERLAGLRRAMTAIGNDQTTPEELAEQTSADKALAQRIHRARPGVPLHHVYAVLQTLRAAEFVDAAAQPAAVSAVVSPPTSRAELRDRIAEALHQDQTPPPTVPWSDEAPMDREFFLRRADAVLAVLPEPTSRAAVLLDAADRMSRKAAKLTNGLDDLAIFVGKARAAEAEILNREADVLRRLAAEAQQQPECVASISGCCLRESQSETACDTEAGECVHGGRPAAEARQDEAQQCPGVETVPNRCTCDCEGCKHHCGAHQAEEEQQPDTEAPTKETGAALARYIADQPMSEIQAAIRILGWPPLRFELVDAAEPAPVQQPAAADTGEEA